MRVCSDGAAAVDLKNCLDYAGRAACSFDPSDSVCGVWEKAGPSLTAIETAQLVG